jgi:serine/threonine-protein kinase
MKRGWLFDAFIGVVLTCIVAAGYVAPARLPLFEALELKTYDWRSALRQNLAPSDEIRAIAIDDNSVSQVGRWPWPRWRMAALLDKLAPAKPRVIGLDIVYSEPEQPQGLDEIRGMQSRYDELIAARKLIDRGGQFGLLFSSAAARLDSDSRLLASLRQAGNVVLPMVITSGGVLGAKPAPLSAAVSSQAVSVRLSRESPIPAMIEAAVPLPPIAPFAEAALGIGHVNVESDFDGVVRAETPVIRYVNTYLPSYALQLALAYAGLKPSEAVFSPGKDVRIGGAAIPLDERNRMLITFNGPAQTFRYITYQDVMNDKVSLDLFKDKIVLIGVTETGGTSLYATPVAPALPAIELTANVIENILHKKFLVRPPWALQLELGLLAFIGLFIMFALPRFHALWGAALSFLLLVFMGGLGIYFFVVSNQWIKVAYPSALLALGYIVVISKRFFVTEKGKELVEASAIETNKMLGLSFQGQGMLDMAFEKFRLCPLDDNMKDTLYNLGLDFERKRQFSKAASVLDHIAKTDPKYRDIAEKTKMLKAAGEGAVFGGVGGGKKEGTVMLAGGATKPTLGRYEIEKELGRGAMGIVYLGRDPKINRQVAIKTMVLDEGGDAGDLKAVKERFFREAESAGTLNHPNIVRIFDAGEESDVAFIAMELLDGSDFTQFTSKSTLLEPALAMEHAAQVADALDYAHANGIVHRDIKPANIMLLKDGTVRVADFGIARITASSKTATGTVMGTPAYMSPEQVAGKKVDGRSDIFSLSVALFELLAGEKPFKGGEGIGTLLFQIANDPHPNVRSVNAKVPPCAAAILDKGLAKNADKRYQRGSEMAADLRRCVAALKSGDNTAQITVPVEPVSAQPPVVEAPPPALEAEPASDATIQLAASPEPAPAETPAVEAPPAPVEAESVPDATIPLTVSPEPVPADAAPAEPVPVEAVAETPAGFTLETPAEPVPVALDPESPPEETAGLRTIEFPADQTLKLSVLSEPEPAELPPAAAETVGADSGVTIKLTKPPEAA